MDNFEYEFHPNEPQKSGGGGRRFLIAILVLLLIGAAFFVGAMSRDYLGFLPEKDTDLITATLNPTLTPIPTVAPTPQATATAETATQIMPYNDIPSVVEKASKGVVSITSYYSSISDKIEEWEPMAYGTGVIITEDGYIVTNHHVIADAGRISVTLYDGEKIAAEVIGSDQYVDLAVLKIEEDGLYNLSFGDSDAIRVGEQVIAIGSPLGDELTGTVTAGIISAVDRQIEVDGIPFTLLQTDAAVNPGNSGGPLVNMDGEVIGINTLKSIFAGYDEYGTAIAAEGISYAIPSNSVQESISDILEYGEILRPFIGVYGGDVSALDRAENSDLPDGFLVADTVEGSPAHLGGILTDDIIVSIEGESIEGFSDLYTIINSYDIGDTIIFTVYRQSTGEEMDLEITLASNQDFK